MEQKFNISGTLEELQAILQKEFGLSADAAHIATAVLVYDQNQEQDRTQLEEDTLGFLNSGQAEYQSSIFSTRYTISFSKVMLEVLDNLIVPGILAVSGNAEIAVGEIILQAFKALLKNLRRIKDNECCVYFRALQNLKTHHNHWFSVSQVMPEVGNEHECINLDKPWQCKFHCGEGGRNCKIGLDDVKDILMTFCEDNVMEKNEEGSLYKFTL